MSETLHTTPKDESPEERETWLSQGIMFGLEGAPGVRENPITPNTSPSDQTPETGEGNGTSDLHEPGPGERERYRGEEPGDLSEWSGGIH